MSPEETQPQLLTQKRAGYALKLIEVVKGKDKTTAAAYGRHVRRFPAMMQYNGLGQALACLLADDAGGINGKADSSGHWKPKEQTVTPAGRLYRDLETWLCGEKGPKYPVRVYSQKLVNEPTSQLIDQLIDGNREQYFRAQQEVIALLHWMKRFADAFLPKDDES
jgi:CRISPR-associated protein Cmr5